MAVRAPLVLLALAILPACSDAASGADATTNAGHGGAAAAGASGLAAGGGATGGAGTNSGAGGAVAGGAAPTAGSDGRAGSSGSHTAGSSGSGQAGSGGSGGQASVEHHLMVIEYPGKLVEISPQGQKLWEHQTPSLTVMFNVLPNGHVFYPHGGSSRGAQEVDREHHVVWSYESPAQELLGGERLENGNSLLGEGGPAKALELKSNKSVERSIAVDTTEAAAHGQIRHLHRLSNGNVLLALEGEGVAREVDPTGKTVWQFPGVSSIHEAIRLENGNTLIGGGTSKRVLEVTPSGDVAWEFNDQDAPELGIAFIASVQPLKNGDLLVCNWLGAGGGNGVHAFQVTRDKRIVWKLDDHQLLKSVTTVTALDD